MQLLKYAVQELLLLSKPLLLCPKAKQLVTVLTQLLVVFTEPNLNPFGLPSYLLFQFAMIIAVDEKKNVYQVVGHDAYSGESTYLPVKDLSAFLSELRNSRGVETNIDVTAYRTVPVSTVIEIFDQCQIQGFTHTRVRLGSKPY